MTRDTRLSSGPAQAFPPRVRAGLPGPIGFYAAGLLALLVMSAVGWAAWRVARAAGVIPAGKAGQEGSRWVRGGDVRRLAVRGSQAGRLTLGGSRGGWWPVRRAGR